MYVVESKGGAIACMLLPLFFLRTWPTVLTLLERRGRLPQHTYLDYTLTNLLAAVIIALTVGEIGKSAPEQPNFIAQLSQDNWPSVLFAMAGGVFLSIGNLSTQYAWAFVGLSLTVVIPASITTVIGTTLNYFLDDKINKAEILFPSAGCFFIAVCLGSAIHSSNFADNKATLNKLKLDLFIATELVVGFASAALLGSALMICSLGAPLIWIYATAVLPKENNKFRLDIPPNQKRQLQIRRTELKDMENGNGTIEKAKAGAADFLVELKNRRAIKVFGKRTFIGLAITFFAGACFSIFSPAFNLATNDQWHTLKERGLPRSSFKAYLNDWNGRGWAFLAGFLCAFGNGLRFMGGQAAGYAAAGTVQALPLVSTFWDILLFGEYRNIAGKHVVYVHCGSRSPNGIENESAAFD